MRTTSMHVRAAAVLIGAICAACRSPSIVDVAPNTLDAKVIVLDNDPNPSDHKVLISVQFFSGGDFVQLGGGAVITANGIELPFNGLANMARVPMVSAGGTYALVHTKASVATPIGTIVVPSRPVISSPTSGANLPRSSSTTITYVAGSGAHVKGSAFGPKAGAGTISTTADDKPDNGTYGPLNTLGFDAGSGRVSLTRELAMSPPGTGLQSVEITYHTGTEVPVVWQ